MPGIELLFNGRTWVGTVFATDVIVRKVGRLSRIRSKSIAVIMRRALLRTTSKEREAKGVATIEATPSKLGRGRPQARKRADQGEDEDGIVTVTPGRGRGKLERRHTNSGKAEASLPKTRKGGRRRKL